MSLATLVLLPGLDGTGLLFQPLLRELPQAWRTQVVAYSMDASADHDVLVERVASVLPPEGPLVLLGESFSGPIAIRLAAQLGARVKALVLCCSFVRNPRPSLGRLGWLIDGLPVPARLPSFALIGPGASAGLRRLLARALGELPAPVMRARLRLVMDVDVSHELRAVRAPVLYLQASHDLVVPPSAARFIQQLQPAVRLVRVAGPHGLLQASPHASAAAMTSFLAGLC